jgi:hypothetical protein
MLGINIRDLVQIAPLLATGGSSALLQGAMQLALKEVGSQAFSRALSQLGVGNQAQLLNTFRDAYSAAARLTQAGSDQLQKLMDASYRFGGLAQSVDNLSDAMTKLTMALGQKGLQEADSASGGGGDSWLVAIARAMGQTLGEFAAKLVQQSQSLKGLAGDKSTAGAQKFQQVMAEFQANSQLFGMLSDAFSNAIKAIGNGMQEIAKRG